MADISHLEAMDGVTFETDRNGIIQGIGTSNWNVFAVQNGALELDAVGVTLSTSLKGMRFRTSRDGSWIR